MRISSLELTNRVLLVQTTWDFTPLWRAQTVFFQRVWVYYPQEKSHFRSKYTYFIILTMMFLWGFESRINKKISIYLQISRRNLVLPQRKLCKKITHFCPYLQEVTNSKAPWKSLCSQQGWTSLAVLYCNTLLRGQHWIDIAPFWKMNNTEH